MQEGHLGVQEVFEKADKLEPTKRNGLKPVASIFDPAGYLLPIVLILKLLFKEICLTNVKWDSRIEVKLQAKWLQVVKSLQNYADLVIKRCHHNHDVRDPVERIYLHGFSYASKIAFGACVYMKATAKSGNVSVSLVTAKSRVTPIRKKLTIPKLELLGNFINFGSCSQNFVGRNKSRRLYLLVRFHGYTGLDKINEMGF